MSFGVNDLTGFTAYNVGTNHPDDPILMEGDAYVAGSERAIAFRIASYDNAGTISSVTLVICDITDGVDTAPVVYSQVVQMSNAASLTWAQYYFPYPVNLTPGRTYCRGFVMDNIGGNSYIGRIAATNYSQRFFSSSAGDGVFPDPFGAGSSNYSFNFSIEVITEPLGPEILSDGTDLEVVHGETHEISFADIDSNPVSVAIVYNSGESDEVVSTQGSFVLGTVTDGAAVATYIAAIGNLPYTNGVDYSAAQYSFLVICADDSEITFSTLSIFPADGRGFVTAVDPVSDETGIMYQWESGDPVTGDQVDFLSSAVTVREDFTFFGPAGETDITLNINYWDSVSQIRYPVSVIVSFDEEGEGTVTGLTTRGFTAEGFTVRGFTARGF